MAGRPCKPDADIIWLWRTLLPNTPLPACNFRNERSADQIGQGADRVAHTRAQAGSSWLRSFWSEKFNPNSAGGD
jgi:hypothetical protein